MISTFSGLCTAFINFSRHQQSFTWTSLAQMLLANAELSSFLPYGKLRNWRWAIWHWSIWSYADALISKTNEKGAELSRPTPSASSVTQEKWSSNLNSLFKRVQSWKFLRFRILWTYFTFQRSGSGEFSQWLDPEITPSNFDWHCLIRLDSWNSVRKCRYFQV